MSLQVWRFQLCLDPDAVVSETDIEIPVAAEILEVGIGSGGVALLALVDPEAERVTRSFVIVGNGVDLPDGVGALNFRGAVKLPGLSLSVFETTKVPAEA